MYDHTCMPSYSIELINIAIASFVSFAEYVCFHDENNTE